MSPAEVSRAAMSSAEVRPAAMSPDAPPRRAR